MNTYLQEVNVDLPSAAINTNSLSLLIKLLKSGEYLTSLAPIIMIDEILSGEIVVLPDRGTTASAEAGLVLNKKRDKRPLVEAFLQSAEELCQKYNDAVSALPSD